MIDERSSSWKILLPNQSKGSILVCGMDVGVISGLARTWEHLDWCPSNTMLKSMIDIPVELAVNMEIVRPSSIQPNRYDIVILGTDTYGIEAVSVWLKSSGVLVCVGLPVTNSWRQKIITAGFNRIKLYGVLPFRSPRIIYPLEYRRLRIKGLGFHRPGSRKANLGLCLLRILSQFIVIRSLNRGAVLLASRESKPLDSPMLSWLNNRFESDFVDLIVYCGSDSARRKITLLAVGKQGASDLIVKVADTEPGKEAIQQEAYALQALEQTPVSTFTPRLLLSEKWNGYYIQVQSSLGEKKNKQSNRITNYHLQCLVALSTVNRNICRISDTSTWQNLSKLLDSRNSSLPEVIFKLAKEVTSMSFSHQEVLTHWVHGDFSPWNMNINKGGLSLWDWEDSQKDGLAFFDIFHFIIRQAVLVGPWPGGLNLLNLVFSACNNFIKKAKLPEFTDYMSPLKVWIVHEYITNSSYRLIEVAADLVENERG